MKNKKNNNTHLKFVALLFGFMYIVLGIMGIIISIFVPFITLFIDQIAQLILILIGVIFLRGYLELRTDKSSGEAFVFVGTIIGMVLGTLAFLEFFFVGIIQGLLIETTISSFTAHILNHSFNPALILGFLTFIPHKMIKHREIKKK